MQNILHNHSRHAALFPLCNDFCSTVCYHFVKYFRKDRGIVTRQKKKRLIISCAIAAAVAAALLLYLMPRRVDRLMKLPEADDWGVELSTEKLSELQTLFDMPSWYAQAVAAPFSDRSPDLARMFYDGLSYDESGAPVYGGYVTPEDGEEWDWVKANVSGAAELDVSRLPRAGMYQVLQEVIYGPQPVPDGLAPEGWTYWDETDCWYFAHGDTGINAVTLLSGRMDGGGLGCLRFEDALGNICTIHVGLGQTEQDAGHLYLRSCETE